jgi:hypothetical protein
MKNQTEKTPVPLSEITLRDFFASLAMHALLSKANIPGSAKEAPESAYWMADKMMEARK